MQFLLTVRCLTKHICDTFLKYESAHNPVKAIKSHSERKRTLVFTRVEALYLLTHQYHLNSYHPNLSQFHLCEQNQAQSYVLTAQEHQILSLQQ